jgi:hypothetical protein
MCVCARALLAHFQQGGEEAIPLCYKKGTNLAGNQWEQAVLAFRWTSVANTKL